MAYSVERKNNKIIQRKVRIVGNRRIIESVYKLTIYAPGMARLVSPGQFLNIKVNNTYRPLLRKPLGIHRVVKNYFVEILYKVVGEGTRSLSLKKKGQYLDILGPLGNRFDCQPDNRLNILVAGGIGVAPLLFLAEKITDCRLLVLLGAKTKKEILCERDFRDLGCEVKIATDDGSRGFKGTASELLRHLLSTIDYRLSTIYACGPTSMLKETARISKKASMPCFGLLEAYMACGTGACFGCTVVTNHGPKLVCKDGPVFDLSTIRW